jgi:lysophospholipase L1-like esterase
LANSLGIDQFKYNLDGFNVCDKVLGANTYDQVENELILSELDDHPNEAGHKAIADFLIEELEL